MILPTKMAACDQVRLGEILDRGADPLVALDQQHVAGLQRVCKQLERMYSKVAVIPGFPG
jgi:hypothetical protein